ncbi:hypothetical protein ABT173_26220 [Streptomyces sp. NPDC001795]|uniref:hypothetical protein n=1 Tax=unclassified Streptomyces TaxID=2593676 RepID=UPI00332A2628
MLQGAEWRRNSAEDDRAHAGVPYNVGLSSATSGGLRTYLRAAVVRGALFVGRTLRGEWRGIVVDPVRRLLRRGLPGLSLAFVAAFGVIFFHAIAQRPTGAVVVRIVGGVKADLPLWLALLRTPVSLYVPALDLPVWAGITQLFLAFALAELILGRARTLAIAYATTLAGTLTVRVMIAMGPGWWGLGLPPEIGQVLDTGPSAAVVGLFTYLSIVRRAPVVFTLTGASMVWESIAKPNLAGREHLIAVGAAIVLGLLHGRGRGRRLRPAWLGLLIGGREVRRAGTGAPVTAPVPASTDKAALERPNDKAALERSEYRRLLQGPASAGEGNAWRTRRDHRALSGGNSEG